MSENAVVHDEALFQSVPAEQRQGLAKYLYAKSKSASRTPTLRQHIIALYDPFASRTEFPAGMRWCANTYVGCGHRCSYCYTANYVESWNAPHSKKDFLKKATKDLDELSALGLGPFPIHISNSTDPFQPLEVSHRHTFGLLNLMSRNPELFSSVTVLTKNPSLLFQDKERFDYLSLLNGLNDPRIEVSLIFSDESKKSIYEPQAPSVNSRMDGISKMRDCGIGVALRIDPLFPRDPLPDEFFSKRTLAEYGIKPAHTIDDIRTLMLFARDNNVKRIVVSPLRIPAGRYSNNEFKDKFRELYRDACFGQPCIKSFSYRLPQRYVHEYLIREVEALGRNLGLEVVHCKNNLIGRK